MFLENFKNRKPSTRLAIKFGVGAIATATFLTFTTYQWTILKSLGFRASQNICENASTLNSYLRSGGSLDDQIRVKNVDSEGSISVFVPEPLDVNLPVSLCAIQYGDEKVAELLLAKGVNFNIQDEKGRTWLHWAAKRDLRNVIKQLIARGADVNAKNLIPKGGVYTEQSKSTPLHWAAGYGHKETVELLIANGADVNVKAAVGKTPLDWTLVYGGSRDVGELLIAKGAKINADILYGINEKSNKDVVDLLLSHDANINSVYSTGSTPLHRVAAEGNKDAVELLIAKGSNINAKAADSLLIESAGKQVNEIDKNVTPLHTVAQRSQEETIEREPGSVTFGSKERSSSGDVAELLIAKGADINARTSTGQTPLHLAVYYGSYELVKRLIRNGADVNAKDNDGITPLHATISPGGHYWVMAEVLLKNNADVNARNNEGVTPLELVFRWWGEGGSKEMAQLLITKGADVNFKVMKMGGITPLQWAVKYGNEDLARLLRQHGATE